MTQMPTETHLFPVAGGNTWFISQEDDTGFLCLSKWQGTENNNTPALLGCWAPMYISALHIWSELKLLKITPTDMLFNPLPKTLNFSLPLPLTLFFFFFFLTVFTHEAGKQEELSCWAKWSGVKTGPNGEKSKKLAGKNDEEWATRVKSSERIQAQTPQWEKLVLALCWGTRGDVPGKRDAVMKAKDMVTDRHWHCQTLTCEKLCSLSSLLVCNLTDLRAQLALRPCLEELGTRSRYRESTKMRCTWSLRSRYLAGGEKHSGAVCRTALPGSLSQLRGPLYIHFGKSATVLILSFLKSSAILQKQMII